MKLHIIGITGLLLLLVPGAGAQTKISGSQKCDKAEVVGTSEVGDKAGHTMSLLKQTCKWATPMEMEGQKTADGTSVYFADVTATRGTDTGTHVGNMDNGDKFFVRFRDTSTAQNGKPVASKGTWEFTSGTGKLKGLSGKGTFTVRLNEDGTADVDVEGEYAVKAPATKK